MLKFLNKSRLQYTKIFLIIFMGGFVLGIVLANTVSNEYLSETGVLSNYFISQYLNMEVSYTGLFSYVLVKRLKWVLISWGLGLTILGIPLVWANWVWLGFFSGVLLSASVMRFGFLGIVICFLGMMPHYIIYIPVWLVFMNIVYGVSIKNIGKSQTGSRILGNGDRKQTFFLYLGALFICALLMMLGAFLESYINPTFLKGILKNI